MLKLKIELALYCVAMLSEKFNHSLTSTLQAVKVLVQGLVRPVTWACIAAIQLQLRFLSVTKQLNKLLFSLDFDVY